MAQYALKLKANGGVSQKANGAALQYATDEEAGCCCNECVQLVRCSDGMESAYTVTRDVADAHSGKTFLRTADGTCYTLGDPVVCGTDAGAGTWFEDCETCEDGGDTDCLEDIDAVSEFGINPTPNGGCSWSILAPHKMCVNGVNQMYAVGTHSFEFLRRADNPLSVCGGDLYVYVNGVSVAGPIAVGDPSVTVGVGAGNRVRIYIDSHPPGLPGTRCGEPGFHDDITTRSSVSGGCAYTCVGYACPGDCALPTAVSYDGITLYQDNSVIMDGTSRHYIPDSGETSRNVEINGDPTTCCWVISESYPDETFWQGVLSGSCVPQGTYDLIWNQDVHTDTPRTVT